jgi:hypothetical protein
VREVDPALRGHVTPAVEVPPLHVQRLRRDLLQVAIVNAAVNLADLRVGGAAATAVVAAGVVGVSIAADAGNRPAGEPSGPDGACPAGASDGNGAGDSGADVTACTSRTTSLASTRLRGEESVSASAARPSSPAARSASRRVKCATRCAFDE